MNSHWSDYWEQGHLTSFGDSFTDNYTGILKDVWEPIFTGLPSDSKFLDIATGNGALTLLASVYLENTGIEVEGIGIDLAKISTDISELKIADNLSLFFKSGVDCTHLPFNDNEFDLVVSQFGIEYSNLDIAIPEALRVLKKKGYLSLVVHHEHSMIILRNSKILAFLNDPRISLFFESVLGLIRKMGNINTKHELDMAKNDKGCDLLRRGLNQQIDLLVQLDEGALKDSELLTYLSTLFKQGVYWDVEKKVKYIEFAKEQILTLKDRLEELVLAAKTQLDIQSIIFNVSKNGGYLKSVSTLYSENDEVLAWHVLVSK